MHYIEGHISVIYYVPGVCPCVYDYMRAIFLGYVPDSLVCVHVCILYFCDIVCLWCVYMCGCVWCRLVWSVCVPVCCCVWAWSRWWGDSGTSNSPLNSTRGQSTYTAELQSMSAVSQASRIFPRMCIRRKIRVACKTNVSSGSVEPVGTLSCLCMSVYTGLMRQWAAEMPSSHSTTEAAPSTTETMICTPTSDSSWRDTRLTDLSHSSLCHAVCVFPSQLTVCVCIHIPLPHFPYASLAFSPGSPPCGCK